MENQILEIEKYPSKLFCNSNEFFSEKKIMRFLFENKF